MEAARSCRAKIEEKKKPTIELQVPCHMCGHMYCSKCVIRLEQKCFVSRRNTTETKFPVYGTEVANLSSSE